MLRFVKYRVWQKMTQKIQIMNSVDKEKRTLKVTKSAAKICLLSTIRHNQSLLKNVSNIILNAIRKVKSRKLTSVSSFQNLKNLGVFRP